MLELIIVLILISISAGILLPRVGAGWKRMESQEFLQEFVGMLRSARINSMNSGEVIAFRISGAQRSFGTDIPPERLIPENVDMYADGLQEDFQTGDKLILFYPDGSLSGTDIEVVFDKQLAYRVFIHPITGNMRVFPVENR
jgi:type II secretory pathway pseudopilin PulG